jgi:hypothetical protein
MALTRDFTDMIVTRGTGKKLSNDIAELTASMLEKANKIDSIVNVQDYGATGLGSTADQTAIQTVLDMAKNNGSVHCIIPDGVYWVTNRLTIYKNTRIQMGKNTVLLRKWAGGFFANGVSGDSFTGYTGNGNILVEGGTLDGNWAEYNDIRYLLWV